jgi:hypothetical protein
MAREDFTKAQRDAWQAVRIAGERARGQHSAKINALPRYDGRTMNPFGPQGSLAKAIDKTAQRMVDRAIAQKAPKGSTIHSTVDSTCLADLSFKDGVATATFFRGGDVVYGYPMDLETFLEWVDSDSIGKFGNDFVFD